MKQTVCDKCGAELQSICPICGKEVEVYSRIVGYLRPTRTWNAGKRQEYADRKEFHLRGDHRELMDVND